MESLTTLDLGFLDFFEKVGDVLPFRQRQDVIRLSHVLVSLKSRNAARSLERRDRQLLERGVRAMSDVQRYIAAMPAASSEDAARATAWLFVRIFLNGQLTQEDLTKATRIAAAVFDRD